MSQQARTASTNQPTYSTRWYQRAGIWLGIGVNPASITLGAGLASRVNLTWLLFLIPLGAFCLSALAAGSGIAGRRQRMSLAPLSTKVFGAGVGALILNLLMGLGMIGWGGFQLGLTGASLSNLSGLPLWLSVTILALTFLALASFELNRWNGMAWVTTSASLALAFVAVVVAQQSEASVQLTHEPTSVGLVLWVIGSCIAFGGLFSIRCTDFAYDLQSDRDVLIDAGVFFVVFTTSLFIGVALTSSGAGSDLVAVFSSTPFAVLGQLFIIASLTAPALSGLHSGSLALAHVLPLSRRVGMWIITIAALLLGVTRFDQSLLPFLQWIGALLPPALVVILVKSFGRNRINNNQATLSWLLGAFVAVTLKLAGYESSLIIGGLSTLIALSLISLRSRKSSPT